VNRMSGALDGDPLLTPGEVAHIFRVDPKTVSRWAKAGRLPSSKTPGGHVRFRRSVILALVDGGAQ
jgi:excisionase family DNA binding protein